MAEFMNFFSLFSYNLWSRFFGIFFGNFFIRWRHQISCFIFTVKSFGQSIFGHSSSNRIVFSECNPHLLGSQWRILFSDSYFAKFNVVFFQTDFLLFMRWYCIFENDRIIFRQRDSCLNQSLWFILLTPKITQLPHQESQKSLYTIF